MTGVHDYLCGSDHFPIRLNNIDPGVDEPVSRWKLNKANWAQFQTLCSTRLLVDTLLKADHSRCIIRRQTHITNINVLDVGLKSL